MVLLNTPEHYLLQGRLDAEGGQPAMDGCDLIIHEGNRSSVHSKVLVGESSDTARQRGTTGPIVAIVGSVGEECVPCFDRDDIGAIARFLKRLMRLGLDEEATGAECTLEMTVADRRQTGQRNGSPRESWVGLERSL